MLNVSEFDFALDRCSHRPPGKTLITTQVSVSLASSSCKPFLGPVLFGIDIEAVGEGAD